jgi:ribonuclease HI
MVSFYAVKEGFNTGIYSTWNECEKQVKGYKNPKFKKFNTYEEAENFNNGLKKETIIEFDPITTIYCDGGFNKHTKPDGWGSVVNGYGVDLVGYYSGLLNDMNLKEVLLPVGKRIIMVSNFNNVTTQQNNGAELLACLAALRISINLINSGITVKKILCDSQTVIYWSIRLNRESEMKFDPLKVNYIKELIQLREIFEKLGGEIVKINGDINKADLGYHK